ncbi:MAG: hypothetical protein R3B82_20540 [Sandaracinaceae bacterium]
MVIQLTHPNTIQFFDFGEIEGRLFIVMEYAEGADPRRRCSVRSDLDRVDHFHRSRGSLHEAHAKGVSTAISAPDNIILTTRGVSRTSKVCDFGIAQRRGGGPEITVEGTIIGMPAVR